MAVAAGLVAEGPQWQECSATVLHAVASGHEDGQLVRAAAGAAAGTALYAV